MKLFINDEEEFLNSAEEKECKLHGTYLSFPGVLEGCPDCWIDALEGLLEEGPQITARPKEPFKARQ